MAGIEIVENTYILYSIGKRYLKCAIKKTHNLLLEFLLIFAKKEKYSVELLRLIKVYLSYDCYRL